jgi:hypothetical protein
MCACNPHGKCDGGWLLSDTRKPIHSNKSTDPISKATSTSQTASHIKMLIERSHNIPTAMPKHKPFLNDDHSRLFFPIFLHIGAEWEMCFLAIHWYQI